MAVHIQERIEGTTVRISICRAGLRRSDLNAPQLLGRVVEALIETGSVVEVRVTLEDLVAFVNVPKDDFTPAGIEALGWRLRELACSIAEGLR